MDDDPVWVSFRNAFLANGRSTGKANIANCAVEFVNMVERLVAGPVMDLELFVERSG
jgi:hypothetical protein